MGLRFRRICSELFLPCHSQAPVSAGALSLSHRRYIRAMRFLKELAHRREAQGLARLDHEGATICLHHVVVVIAPLAGRTRAIVKEPTGNAPDRPAAGSHRRQDHAFEQPGPRHRYPAQDDRARPEASVHVRRAHPERLASRQAGRAITMRTTSSACRRAPVLLKIFLRWPRAVS
jgi:hypothetical protein